MNDETASQVINASYIIESLRDSILVIQKMMQDLSPSRYFSVSELAVLFPEYSQNKIYRIVKTFQSIGWIEADTCGRKYKIGHELLYLSHRYIGKLDEAHRKIRDEINSFGVHY